MAELRTYYDTQQRVYWLLTRHPGMSFLLTDFDISKEKIEEVSQYLLTNHNEIFDTPISAFFDDSEIIDDIATIYGFSNPPWSQYYSPSNTPLLELLNMTLFVYKFGVTDNFYEQNILDFIPEFDREEIKQKPKLKLSLEAVGRKLDELEDHISRMTDLYNIDKAPEHVLDYLGQNIGYEREDFSLSNLSFRDLLSNIIEIYKIKGTNYSFSFFFKFLGFDISLKEFYFNRDVDNPENFPGMDENSVEYYLTTKNPKFDYGDSSLGIKLKPAKYLRETRNLDDWLVELQSLTNNGCSNPARYMLGLESYNNDTVTFHKNPWTYFKTNLIEYELNPFFNKLNLTANDNTTIRKYIRFLSPTYLFTWINVNLRPWIEDINIINDLNDETNDNSNWKIDINKTLGDPRPTPEPWPFTRKVATDIGFNGYFNDGNYLEYEDAYDQLEYRFNHGYWQHVEINDLIEVDDTFINITDLPIQVEHGDSYYILSEAIYYSWDDNVERFIKKYELDESDEFKSNLQTRFLLPEKIKDGSLYYVSSSDEYYEWSDDQYNLIDPLSLITILGEYQKISYLPKNAKRNEIYKTLLPETLQIYEPEVNPLDGTKNYHQWIQRNVVYPGGLYKRISQELTIDIINQMNLGGYDTVGTVLRRNGVHIRQVGHPKHITDARHRGDKKLAFDTFGASIKLINEDNTEYRDYSYRAWPQSPARPSPFNGEQVVDSNSVIFSWDEVEGRIQYWTQISRNRSFTQLCSEDMNIQTHEYACPQVLHNNNYYWRVRSKNELDLSILTISEMNSIIQKITEAYHYNDGLSNKDPLYRSQYSFLDSDDLNFSQKYYNFTGTNHTIKDDLTSSDIIRMNQILVVIGKKFDWGPWSNSWNFILKVVPFPFDGEIIDMETYFVTANYNQSQTKRIFQNAEFDILWDRTLAAIEYEVEFYVGGVLIPPTRTTKTNSLTITFGNNTYQWRYRSKNMNNEYSDWSQLRTFTIDFDTIIEL